MTAPLTVRLAARVLDAAVYPLVVLVAGPRCPLCREHTRHLAAHVWVNHFGDVR